MRASAAFVLCLCLWALPAQAARTIAVDQPILVKLELGQPTAVVFPETIKSVALSVSAERFSLDTDGPYLFLLALDPAIRERCFVTGHSGKLYKVAFTVGTPADDVVHLVLEKPQATHVQAQPISPPTLVQALATSTALPGQQPADLPPPAMPDPRVTLADSHAVSVGPVVGMVLGVANTTTDPVALDLRIGDREEDIDPRTLRLATWTFPPRYSVRAVAADHALLEPGQRTNIYLVLERRP
jgi:hypothetical protein